MVIWKNELARHSGIIFVNWDSNYNFNPYTINYYQMKCHEAMEGNWETMTDEEIEKRCDQWSENLRLQ